MPTYFKASTVLLSKFNQANGTSLTSDQVEWGIPMPAEQVDPAKALMYNTAITLKMLPGASRTGSVTLFYNRIDLAREFASFPSLQNDSIIVNDISSTTELADVLELKLGLRIDESQIVDYPISLKNDYVTTRFEAKSNSMEYVGGFNVKLYNGTPAIISNLVVDKFASVQTQRFTESGYTVVENDYTNVVAKTDYTPIANFLASRIPTGGYPGTTGVEGDGHWLNFNSYFPTLLSDIDGIPWVYNTTNQTTQPNTNSMLFLFNGKTKDFNAKPRDQWMKYASYYRGPHDAMYVTDIDSGAIVDESFDRVLVAVAHWPYTATKLYRSLFFFHYNVGADNEYLLQYR